MKWKQAAELLEECERGLRKLVAEAAQEGDYPSVERIAYLAKAVGGLIADQTTNQTKSEPERQRGAAESRTAAPKPGRRPAAEYPKFFRRGNELVKVGWSKKDRREYNHRAPREVVALVASAVRQAGARGRLFNGDALLPLKDPADGRHVPSYQVYVTLAWLVRLGALKQAGPRAGYTVVESKPPEATATAAWAALPEWQG